MVDVLGFLNILFENGESICVAKSIYDTKVTPLNETGAGVFLSINPLLRARNDANVTAFSSHAEIPLNLLRG